jgi:hypothetical protein
MVLTRNTFIETTPLLLAMGAEESLKEGELEKVLRVQASGNVFDGRSVLLEAMVQRSPSAEAEVYLKQRVGWRGDQNLFAAGGTWLNLHPHGNAWKSLKPINSLADWQRFWGSAEKGSIEGEVRYRGGDLHSKLRESPEKLTPDDFRLRSDSAGHAAGEDGKDLGADIDLVGPGAAYERWKKTPEYQQWLKDTEQVRAP